jgi:hypothetical protein
MAAEAERRAIVVTNATVALATPFVSFVAGRPLLGFPLRAVEGEVARWAQRGRVEQRLGRAAAAAFLRDLVPEVVRAVLEQIDIDAVVAEVDIDRILDRVDMERVLARIDVDEVITRVDVNRVVERIDVDAVIGRVDVNAVVNRVDLPGITEQVMDEVNIGEVIRESTGSVTTQAVDAVRFQGMSMDRFVARVIDRMLMRRGERGETLPADPPSPEPQPADPAGAP